ncbi:MAG TPA: DUF998 domain-containing protein [Acidimicrobiia bacterium]|nr:DUF998 domain-containing protein [Acidimicrobiia bacterium]
MTDSDRFLAAGIAGSALFVVVFLVDGATRPGYRPGYHLVSALARGCRGWIQTTNFLVCGLLITVSARGIEFATSSGWLSGAIGVFGLGLVASGIFPMDPMRGYPPGTPEGTPDEFSRAHRWHDMAGFIVFGLLPVAAATAAFTLDSTAWAIYSGATAVLTAIGFVVFGAAWEQDHPRAGLIQRTVIVVGWIWLAALCTHLMA